MQDKDKHKYKHTYIANKFPKEPSVFACLIKKSKVTN
jgi:hypothetical protein